MGEDHTSDDQLLKQVARGDADAFSVLFRRRRGDVYRFALHMTGRPAVADDVTQDTFLAVMRDAGRYDATRATAVAWLCGIARHHVLRRFERERSVQTIDLDDELVAGERSLAVDDSVLGELTRAQQVEAVRDAVMTLPFRYREAVVLCDLQELSYADAAAALGCALGTVRSRLHRGRALLASKLAADRVPSAVGQTPQSAGTPPEHERAPDGVAVDSSRERPKRAIQFGQSARTVRRLA
jgi:RNA polymerase sigma-70 factor (ECF subfamily)